MTCSRKLFVHRVFVYILRSENRIFVVVLVCQDLVKLLKLY